MRILIATGLFPPEVGGPATYSKLLLEELPKRGIEVVVLPFSEVRSMPKVLRHVAYFFKVLRGSKGCDIIFALDPVSVGLPAIFAAKIAGKRFFIKIVGDYAWEQFMQMKHARPYRTAVFGTFGRDSRFMNHDGHPVTPEEFQKNKYDWLTELRRKVEHFVTRGAEVVIVPSNYLKGIVEVWGISGDKIKVIYNAFDAPRIEETKEDIRNKLNLKGTMILSVGRLVPWKGFETLIHLMPSVVKEIPDARLYIAGDGPQEEFLRQIVKDKDLQDFVVFLGRLTQTALFKYIRAADIFALNTGYEGFSHQLLEVMAIGTPIVTTSVGGNTELITDNLTGLLIKYNDMEALETVIVKISKDKELATRLSSEAKKRVLDFSKEKMLNELIATMK